MQFSDLPITALTAVPVIPHDALESYIQGFVTHLETNNVIATSSTNNTLKAYLKTVNYGHYALCFDDYWASITNKSVETIFATGLQAISVLTRKQIPAKTVFRDIAKVKVAETLLARFVE